MLCMQNKQEQVHIRLTSALEVRKEKNLKVLESIVETVVICGRQNIPLRMGGGAGGAGGARAPPTLEAKRKNRNLPFVQNLICYL